MKRFFNRRLVLFAAAIVGVLLCSGALTSCDVMLDPDTMYAPEERGLLDDVLAKIEDALGSMTPGDALPDIDTDVAADPEHDDDPHEDVDPDYAYTPDTDACDAPVTEPAVDEDQLPDIGIPAVNYYTTAEETGLSFTDGYVDQHMYLYGRLERDVRYTDTERLVPGVQVIDSYDEFCAMFDMSRREFVTNARNTEGEAGTESTFWTQLSRITKNYFDNWSLVVILTPDAVEPFVNGDVRTYPIVAGRSFANITAIDLRTTEVLSDSPAAAYAVIVPLHKNLNDVVDEDIVLGYNGNLFIDERLYARVGDDLGKLILNFDRRITEEPTWPVIKDPDVSIADVLEKSRVEDGILHAFLPEDPQLPASDRTVFWVNSADDIPRYLSFCRNENVQNGLESVENSPAYALLQSYLDKGDEFFEDQWLVLVLLREDSWSVSYDADVETSGHRTDITINPVTSGELDNRRVWWLLAVPVEAGNDYTVTVNDPDGTRHVSSYKQDRRPISLETEAMG